MAIGYGVARGGLKGKAKVAMKAKAGPRNVNTTRMSYAAKGKDKKVK
jgi:hypothetical protein